MLPLFVRADFTATPAPTLKNINLVLKVNGVLAKGTVAVAKNADVVLEWTSLGKGCVNNWDSNVLPSSNSLGSITTSRTFIITCYGIGAAQAAKVQVVVAFPDISITSVKVDGLKPVLDTKGKPKAKTFKASEPFSLSVGVKNSGRLGITKPFSVQVQGKYADTDFVNVGEAKTVSSLKNGGSTTLVFSLTKAAPSSGRLVSYRVVVDSTNAIDEDTKGEANNSKSFGPFMFE